MKDFIKNVDPGALAFACAYLVVIIGAIVMFVTTRKVNQQNRRAFTS